MDAIRKKMQSLKAEITELTEKSDEHERKTKEFNAQADECDVFIRDYGKKIHNMESDFDDTTEKLLASQGRLAVLMKRLNEEEGTISALNRRIMLLEEESNKAEQKLGVVILDLAKTSKVADTILKKVKSAESKNMNNEVVIEDLDKSVREAVGMKTDGHHKLDELTRRLGVLEEELRRSSERANNADAKVASLEEELRQIGENMKILEVAEEKALWREEKFQTEIKLLMVKLKGADRKQEYGEKNINKLNHRIDEIEDDIVRQKLKVQKVANEMDDTFDDMMVNY